MMQGNIGQYVIENGFVNSEEHVHYNYRGKVIVYEVVRVMKGKLLFAEDHLNRLENSFIKSGLEVLPRQQVVDALQKCIEQNNMEIGNVRIDAMYQGNQVSDWYIYQIKHNYPGASMTGKGVRVALCEAVRPDPEIKCFLRIHRLRIGEIIERTGVFEVLMHNEEGELTEGSRSNVFFVKGDKLITASASSVLNGITRQKVIALAKEQGIDVEERIILKEELNSFDAAFLTGTSINVLPIVKCDDILFDVNHPLMSRLSRLYLELIQSNIG
ncbi:hypothetical protein EYV94_00340 [Puteibacter caeruleilacunae]|nr:hypothetical protein EYV94_00340 [Puteibacter caeruleilacunae]